MMLRPSAVESTVLGVPLLAALLACGQPDGGLNLHQKAPGDQPGGVSLDVGDIAVSPDGEFLVFERGTTLAVGWPSTGAVDDLPLNDPSRLAFSKSRPVVYVGTFSGADSVVAVDVARGERLWEAGVETAAFRIASSNDDRHVVVSYFWTLAVFDAETGQPRFSKRFDRAIVDFDILPQSDRVVVTTEHEFTTESNEPSTSLFVVDLEAGGTVSIDVPNCSDELVVTPDGRRAFLAPTTCRKDPVSLIDLDAGAEAFVRNLPGFGPVAMAPDGVTAVAFVDNRIIERELFDDPPMADDLAASSTRFHIMVLNTETLSYELAAVGEDLPRYAMTPDGEVLLIDSARLAGNEALAPIRLFDTGTMTLRSVTGPAVELDNFSINSRSTHAYALQDGLFDIDLRSAETRSMRTEFLPENINISPDDSTLFLRIDEHSICVYSIADESCRRSITLVPRG